jgi:hypothetical protein
MKKIYRDDKIFNDIVFSAKSVQLRLRGARNLYLPKAGV